LLFVNGPVLLIIIAGVVGGAVVARSGDTTMAIFAVPAGAVLGSGVAWIWWSFAIPRWRDWVIDVGLTPRDVQDLAVRVGLVWPVGSFFERTERRRRDGRRGW